MPALIKSFFGTLVVSGALVLGGAHVRVQPAVAQAPPQFNPSTFQCANYPFGPVIQGSWQTSAPREGADFVRAGDSLQLGLRNKNGGPSDSFDTLAQVWAPDGTLSAAETTVSGSDWTMLTFPDDFSSNPTDGIFVAADTGVSGVYTVLWTIGPLNVACDGFVVH